MNPDTPRLEDLNFGFVAAIVPERDEAGSVRIVQP
jgi:hypothetical protein